MDIMIRKSWRALGLASLLLVLSVFGFQGRAQHLPDELHFNLDWQVNFEWLGYEFRVWL